jgi:hypothetical protein
MKLLIISVLLSIISDVLSAQDTIKSNDGNILYGLIVDGDTVYVSTIEDVYILPEPKFTSKRDMRKYQKLIYNVKVTLPYAKLAKQKYDEVSAVMLTLKTDKEKKDYMEQVEIGETSYDLLIELRGKFSAFFWQTLARIFGHNLKSTFDPEGEDQLLNEIIIMIENGQL